jgi:type VI secretion system secreted protein VgrG
MEAEQALDHRCQAVGDAISCVPGFICEVAEHPEPSQNGRYIITRATHTFVSDSYRTTGAIDVEELYTGHYEFLPQKYPFRAPLITPRPVVRGTQTALVVGSGEIDVDRDGCIMVRFHWDRDEQDSRRVRLAQVWSGKAWGGIYIPRVGMEVVVTFIEGDPDHPLVIGTVYNRDNPVPYDLPKDKTIAGVKSKSSPSGGYNEFVFEDKQGSELVRMHAEKDLGVVVEHDESREVKNDVKQKVGNDKKVDIGNTLKVEAGTLIELTVGQSKIKMDPGSITISSPQITIKADMTLDASGTMTTVKGNAILTLQGGLVKIN